MDLCRRRLRHQIIEAEERLAGVRAVFEAAANDNQLLANKAHILTLAVAVRESQVCARSYLGALPIVGFSSRKEHGRLFVSSNVLYAAFETCQLYRLLLRCTCLCSSLLGEMPGDRNHHLQMALPARAFMAYDVDTHGRKPERTRRAC